VISHLTSAEVNRTPPPVDPDEPDQGRPSKATPAKAPATRKAK
jgi:hypothetical protein